MRRVLLSVLVLTVMFLAGSAEQSQAYGPIGDQWLAAYPGVCPTLADAAKTAGCTLCHTGGFGFNDYGQDVKDNSIAAIANVDSDGDGRTNDEEILTDCTFPGDPLSVPGDIDSWGSIKALFR